MSKDCRWLELGWLLAWPDVLKTVHFYIFITGFSINHCKLLHFEIAIVLFAFATNRIGHEIVTHGPRKLTGGSEVKEAGHRSLRRHSHKEIHLIKVHIKSLQTPDAN